jgi:hypothetical protein
LRSRQYMQHMKPFGGALLDTLYTELQTLYVKVKDDKVESAHFDKFAQNVATLLENIAKELDHLQTSNTDKLEVLYTKLFISKQTTLL